MKKKEYEKPEINIMEIAGDINILAGSGPDTVKIDLNENVDDGDGGEGYGNGEGTGYWD